MKKIFFVLPCIFGLTLFAQDGSLPTQKVVLNDGTEVLLDTQYKTQVKVKEKSEPLRRKMAIFVTNNAGDQFSGAVTRIRTQLAAQLAGSELEVMDYNETTAAINPLLEGIRESDGVQQVAKAEATYKLVQNLTGRDTSATANGRNTTQDEKLLANTSFTRLAQNMGADYVLMVSLDKFTKNKGRAIKNKYIKEPIRNSTYKLSSSYKVLDAFSGTAIGGGTLHATKSVRQSGDNADEFGEYADALEETLVEDMTEDMLAKSAKWREASKAASGIKVEFIVTACDMNNKPIYLPKYDGVSKIVNDRTPATVAATIEVDGVAMGTTSCVIPLAPGLHKIRINRPGYDDVAMTINPSEGASFAITMRMTEGEYNRIKDSVEFMHTLTMQRELSQAEVQRILGDAKRLEQSGFRVDTKEAPQFNTYKSLY